MPRKEDKNMCYQPFIGELAMFAGDFAPRGWALCDGQLLDVEENSALYSLLGTRYGGDGRNTFALPDLRGRVPIHPGSGPGLSRHGLGQRGGQEFLELTESKRSSYGWVDVAGRREGDTPIHLHLDHGIMQPYLCINFIIALEGLYPSRS
jgi:microcystin-dependent protein